MIDEVRRQLGLDNPDLSPKTTMFTLHKLIEMILLYLMTNSLVAPTLYDERI